jgi:bacteriorhodopsin
MLCVTLCQVLVAVLMVELAIFLSFGPYRKIYYFVGCFSLFLVCVLTIVTVWEVFMSQSSKAIAQRFVKHTQCLYF